MVYFCFKIILKDTINFLTTKDIGEEKEIIFLLKNYTKTLSLLESYDKSIIEDFEANEIFGNEKADELDGIIGNLYQTFGGAELYESIEDKATHLLYLIIKEHPFTDGNKRIASFLFVYFFR